MVSRLGAFVLIVIVCGIHHAFLTPSVCAVVALTTARTQGEILAILGAWFVGIVYAAFVRGR